MYSTYDDSEERGCLYITAYVATDSPYLFVYWYIDGVHQSTSGGPSTSAYFSPNTSEFPGSSDGTTYTIEAVAYQYDPETNLMLSDTDSYSVTVYTPCDETAASLTATIVSCSWNGRTASAAAKATIEHTGGDDAPDVEYLFKFTFRVVQIKRNNDDWKADVHIPPLVISQGRVEPGDAKVSDHFSDSFTLGNGWEANDRFKVETKMVVWARNAKRGAEPEECDDTGSDILKIE